MPPFASIPFSVPGGKSLTLNSVIRYRGDYLIVGHQFGFFRINAQDGTYTQRCGVTYNNPAFPPSNIGLYIIGDHNQSVTQIAVSDDWIVVDNTAAVEGPDPSALVWNNDAGLSFHGIVYSAAGFRWQHSFPPGRIDGNLLYAPSGTDTWDVMNLQTLAWTGSNVTPPAADDQTDIGGFTYSTASADGTQINYVATRAGAAPQSGTIAVTLSHLLVSAEQSATATGAIAVTLSPLQVGAASSVSGTISATLSPLSVAATGVVGEQVLAPIVLFDPYRVQTEEQLKIAVNSNTEFTTCPLDHGTDYGSFHKEPLILLSPGSRADTNTERVIYHTRQPDGNYLTTTGIGYASVGGAAPLGAPCVAEEGGGLGGFVDSYGRTYSATGAPTGALPVPQTTVRFEFGYFFDIATGVCTVGAQVPPALAPPSYDDLVIGDFDDYSGYRGPQISAYFTSLCRGVGPSTGKLLGLERKHDVAGDFTRTLTNWTLHIRDATTFAVLAMNPATYITDWFTTHSAKYSSQPETGQYCHISTDPDGSFWIDTAPWLLFAGPPHLIPMWHVSGTDGSLIELVQIQYVTDIPITDHLRVELLP